MSGHSKWAQIKRQKGVADAKKGVAFTRFANAITAAAREGGKDPDMNFRLRLAIDRARGANMPKENIERAILRGAGGSEGKGIENVTYEGYGPGGVAIIVDALTDNRNRTSSEIRRTFTEFGGSLGGANTVLWMFDRRGRLTVTTPSDRPATELAAIDAGALDVWEEDGALVVDTTPSGLGNVRDAVLRAGGMVTSAEVLLVAKTTIKLEGDDNRKKLIDLLAALEDAHDVTGVATNADV